MNLTRAIRRGLLLLGPEARLAWTLTAANLAIALVQLAEPILFGRVVDALSGGRAPFFYIALWAGFGLFGIAAGVLVSLHADRLAHRRRVAVMADAFDRAITLPITYVAEHGSGRIVRNMLLGADALFLFWLGLFREQQVAVASVVLLAPVALAINPWLASILIGLGALYVAANTLVVRRTESGQTRVEKVSQEVSSRVGDVIGNVPVVHAYATLQAESAGLRGMTARLLDAQFPVLTWWAFLSVLTRAAATLSMVAIFAAGAYLASRGLASVGEIVSFVVFATLLIGRLDQIAGFFGRLFVQSPTIGALFELLDAKGVVRDSADAKPLGPIEGRVAFERVTYRFPGSTLGVFDISFHAEAGETVALVGRTGAGKTTALALLQRLRDPEAGRITLDGRDVREVTLRSLREAMAVVFQDAGLFNRSIAENLRLGKADATAEELEAVARAAEAHDFIVSKPGGYNFVIGERGALLSGGERQRLAIARAMLKDAPILLLDEATSALDTVTEAKIKRALDRARAGRTTLIIAHRLSTVIDADQILVFEQGRIVERGDFDTLAQAGGPFSAMLKEGEGGATSPTPRPRRGAA